MRKKPDGAAAGAANADHRKIGCRVDLDGKAKLAAIKFDRALYVGNAKRQALKANIRHGATSVIGMLHFSRTEAGDQKSAFFAVGISAGLFSTKLNESSAQICSSHAPRPRRYVAVADHVVVYIVGSSMVMWICRPFTFVSGSSAIAPAAPPTRPSRFSYTSCVCFAVAPSIKE